jgi:nucleoside-diphosphate-sugar epimerase
MMRVLVLGANGFLGRRLVAALAASDWAVPVAGVRQARGTAPAETVLDATSPDQVAAAIVGADAVVQCVAGDPGTIVASARALFDAPAGPRIVHLSSMAVYGDAIGLVGEDAPLNGTGGYAGAKVEAERLARARGDVTVLRPGCIYGGGSPQWSRRIAALLRARRIGDLGAEGDGCSNVVHVDDVVAAILATLRRDETEAGAINLAMPGAPDWNAYFLAYARALGAVPIARIPGWRLRAEAALAFPLTLAERARLPVPPAITPGLLRLWRQDIRLDPARADRLLGGRWTSLADGVAEAAASVNAAG